MKKREKSQLLYNLIKPKKLQETVITTLILFFFPVKNKSIPARQKKKKNTNITVFLIPEKIREK